MTALADLLERVSDAELEDALAEILGGRVPRRTGPEIRELLATRQERRQAVADTEAREAA